MSEAIQKKLLGFVAGELARKDHREVVRFSLLCAQPNTTGEPVRDWNREDDPDAFEMARANDLACQIIEAAQSYSDGMGPGTHRYKVIATQHLGGTTREMFRLAGAEGANDPVIGEDSATPIGLVAQAMRHAEYFAQLAGRMSSAAATTLAKRLDASEENLIKFMAERRESFEELESARSQADDRAIAMMRQQAQDARKDKAVDKALTLAPAVVNRFVGSKMIAEGQTPKEQMLASLAASLVGDGDRIAKILEALRPHVRVEEMILLVELLKTSAPKPEANDTDGGGRQPSPNGAH